MYNDLAGKTAIITGAGQEKGIGFAIARKLAQSGVNIILTDLNSQSGEKSGIKLATFDEIRNLTDKLEKDNNIRAQAFELDVTDNQSIKRMLDKIKEKFDKIDILVNNAGTAIGVPNSMLNYNEDAWLKTLDVNLNGTFRVSRAIIPFMLRNKKGSVINISSKAGKSPIVMNGAYAVSKAAVIMLTKVMAMELGQTGVRVNAICPGIIMTGMQEWRFQLEAKFFNSTPEERQKEKEKEIPLGYAGTPDQVADLAAFLASDESSYITGQALNVCGGQLMEI